MAQQIQAETDPALAGLESSVFENANTITKWLLSQAEDNQPQ